MAFHLGRAPVSYTHLDVYKRQVLVFGEDGFEMEALCHMRDLMEEGVRCESSVFDTLSDTLAYAKAHGIQRVDVVRENCRTIETGEGDEK